MTTEKLKFQACLSRESDHWATPKYIYDQIKRLGFHDPCPLHSEKDGLGIEWKEKNFVNPPYSKLKQWVNKSIDEARKGKEVILLIPARTDTRAFEMLSDYGSEFTFIIGRLHFNDSNSAPFPSVIVKLIGGRNEISFIRKEKPMNFKRYLENHIGCDTVDCGDLLIQIEGETIIHFKDVTDFGKEEE